MRPSQGQNYWKFIKQTIVNVIKLLITAADLVIRELAMWSVQMLFGSFFLYCPSINQTIVFKLNLNQIL